MLHEHQAKIDRLNGMDRVEVQRIQLLALIDGVRRGELTAADVTTYTNITPEQLAELIGNG